MSTNSKEESIRTAVREHYTQKVEKKVAAASCCNATTSIDSQTNSSVDQLYEDPDAAALPADVTGLSLGCGDPITLASLRPGQTVLDLGSGGGIDCFLAAKKVGQTGKVIGVDMTPAMLSRARANKEKMDANNVEFRLGEIEHLPVEDQSVDVIISNCVINLSPDKQQVFREALRVLKPGGKLAVSDIVTVGELPEAVKKDMEAWAGCLAGALQESQYLDALREAGFEDIQVNPVYFPKEMVDDTIRQNQDMVKNLPAGFDIYRAIFSAKISARKPVI